MIRVSIPIHAPSNYRSRRVKGSCAFEHVFLGEVKRGVVKGFHNWLFFLMQEQKGEVGTERGVLSVAWF